MLRFATIKDAKQILEIYSPYVENTTISFETIVPSLEEMETRIKKVLPSYPWLVFEEEDLLLGYAYASKHRERAAYRWAVDVSIYVRQNNRGKGIGKTLYTALFPLIKSQGFYNAYAGICLPNDASVGIHEFFGFEKVAHYHKVGNKFGQWYDVGWWELFLDQHKTEPGEPLPIGDNTDFN